MGKLLSSYLSLYPDHHREFQEWTNHEMLRALYVIHPTVEDAHHYRLVLWSEFLHISHVYYGLRESVSIRLFNDVFIDFLRILMASEIDVSQIDLKKMFISGSKKVIKNKATKLEKQKRKRSKK